MSANEPVSQPPALTSLPRLEDVPTVDTGGYDPEKVREAFDSFRRHSLQLQAQLRVLQAAGTSSNIDPTGHAVRMDALHLIRAAAEFADALERDAQNASASQLSRTEVEVTRRQHDLQAREREVERFREESERQRNEIVNAAKAEARELLATANRDAATELREAEAKGTRLLEQSRHQATELTNAARAEVEQTLEWARAQAGAILARAQQGAEQLLTAAGLGADALGEVSDAIVVAARSTAEANRSRAQHAPAPPEQPAPRISAVPEEEPEEHEPEVPVAPPVSAPPPVSSAPEAATEPKPEPEAEPVPEPPTSSSPPEQGEDDS